MRARILNASAGSGKTYQLAYKYVRDVVEQPGIYRHILAVTFTNKATNCCRQTIADLTDISHNRSHNAAKKLCFNLFFTKVIV